MISSDKIPSLIRTLQNHGPVVWLDAHSSSHPEAEVSIIGAVPHKIISGSVENGVWEALAKQFDISEDWWFGYLGYDMKNDIERLYSNNKSIIEAPDYWFILPQIVIKIDHTTGEVSIVKGKLKVERIVSDMPDSHPLTKNVISKIEPLIPKEDYIGVVRQIQQDIYEGRYYELNYTYPLKGRFEGDPLTWYQDVQSRNAVPFGAYINQSEITLCCFSPERFLKRSGQRIISQPIKGTRGRANTSEEDQRLREELVTSIKDKAENLMIVDLVRNDFHRIADTGSVRVDPLFEIQTFPTVHQLVSTVHGTVDANANPFEIIKACFPMGSMTGAPKIEVMKRIEELEMYRRGIYSGTIGYIKPDGDFDFNVVIRTALIQGKDIVFPVGGAITSDSNPESEWKETIVKARALAQL